MVFGIVVLFFDQVHTPAKSKANHSFTQHSKQCRRQFRWCGMFGVRDGGMCVYLGFELNLVISVS